MISTKGRQIIIFTVQIERIIPLAGDHTPLKSTFHQSKENNLKQNHLWLAPFFRPPRSRFTR